MRKNKRNDKLKPYLLGTLLGYAAVILTVFPAALILSFMKTASKAAGAAAVISLAAGAFICGKIAGFIRQRDGLKTGILCGVLFCVPMLVFTLIFSRSADNTVLKAALCVAFAAVGGVSGVNSSANK